MAGALPHVRVATGPNTFATSMHRQCLVTPGASPLAAGATLLRQRWRQQQRQQTRRLPGLAVCGFGASSQLTRRHGPCVAVPTQQQQQRRLQQPCSLVPAPLPVPLGLPPLPARRPRCVAMHAVYGDPLVNLGTDFLTFLIATVLVVPVFKSAKQSPVLGYLFAGLVLGQLGLFRNLEEVEKLSELGVLFLLFEMGLELSIDRLRALARFAFGMGTLQMLICTLAFAGLGLPPGGSWFSAFLENVLHAPASLANLRTVDEAVVIGAALALSSSAFVLQLLRERAELDTRFGQATLGILLLQDIATVPFLVLLPLIEGNNTALLEGQDTMSLLQELGPTAAKTIGGLAAVLLGGRFLMRRVFELVAAARSEETFIALCLLSVTGASLLTQRMGFSDTLGAFAAGVLLSETNFKTQIEADIQPFRGILLGLFFVTTGSSLDVSLLLQQWPLVLTLLAGLLALKITVITALGPLFGLSKAESVRTGFLLSQGGEFAFVLLALANQLNVLPAELNRLLIIVVVLSMALTPLLAEAGKQLAKKLVDQDPDALYSSEGYNMEEPIVVCGFGGVGQTVANILASPALGRPLPYIAFDNNPARVQAAQEAGFNVLFGDGSRKKVLHAAGVERPKAIAVGYTARQRAVTAVEALHEAYPGVPIYVRALDLQHAAALKEAGASTVIVSETEAGLAVGSQLARGLGVPARTVSSLASVMRRELDARAAELAAAGADPAADGPAVPIFKFDQTKAPAPSDDPISSDSAMAAELGGLSAGGGLLSTLISTLESVGTMNSVDGSSTEGAPGTPPALGSTSAAATRSNSSGGASTAPRGSDAAAVAATAAAAAAAAEAAALAAASLSMGGGSIPSSMGPGPSVESVLSSVDDQADGPLASTSASVDSDDEAVGGSGQSAAAATQRR
ncbi:hypothetical protein ABPG77_002858 [Micractinium sp. CCAP 211/92]